MTGPLLTTKFYIAPLRPGYIRRPRLLARLDEGLVTGKRLILVSAPAGYGKTSLVSDWLAAHGPALQHAWVSLDAGDNEPARLLAYLIEALRELLPGETYPGLRWAADLLLTGAKPPTPQLVDTLLNGLAAIPQPTVVVLDDYQVISAQAAHQVVRQLLDGLPPYLHVLITTRVDPPLGLIQLRVRDQLCELRLGDLYFTTSEATRFLNETMNLGLADADAAEIQARTEGWIAGLQMAALSMRGHANPHAFIRDFGGSSRFVLEYLLEEVLDRQPPVLQSFLLRTSILDRLSAEVCDAVLDPAPAEGFSSQALLEALESAQLFAIPLDDQKRWYRYHHLFTDLLRHRLRRTRPGEVSALHLRASAWYERQGLLVEAIQQARADPDADHLADLLERHVLTFFYRSEIVQVRQWLEWLPEAVRRGRPLLAAVYGAVLALSPPYPPRSLDAAERWMQLAETATAEATTGAVEEQVSLVRAFAAKIRSYWARFRREPIAAIEALAERALAALPPAPQDINFLRIRSAVHANLGLAYWESGDAGRALDAFGQTRRLAEAGNDLFNLAAAVKCQAQAAFWQGQLNMAAERCAETSERCRAPASGASRTAPFAAGLGVLLGEVRLEWNTLDEAERLLQEHVELARWTIGPTVRASGLIALARLEAARGSAAAAGRYLDQAEQVSSAFSELAAAQRALLWLAESRHQPALLDRAQAWLQSRSLHEFQGYQADLDFAASIGLARVIVAEAESGARHTTSARDKGVAHLLEWLERQMCSTLAGEWHHWTIQLLVIDCRARQVLGDLTGALAALHCALELAAPGGYVRVFTDEGQAMHALLARFCRQAGALTPYVERLLASFPASAPLPGAGTLALIEPLTAREREVLGLVAQGKSNHEIAAALVVSLNTVKKHTHHLFAKLSVENRSQAIVRAQQLRLL